MKVHVLGSSAGGGFPQWNCNCPNCTGVRTGSIDALPRTQSSIALSSNSVDWVLFNTSPDILVQLAAFPPLQPARAVRDTAIKAIIYMDSHVDHTTGLLMLREGCPHDVYCTDSVFEDLTSGFPVFTMLDSWNGGIHRHVIPIDGRHFAIPTINGIQFTAVPLASKAPPYSPHRDVPQPGDNIGILAKDVRTGKTLFYAPGLGEVDQHLISVMAETDCLMIDGTFWTDDELAQVGLSEKTARAIGHLPQSGAGGMIDVLRRLTKPRKILIHINNTNPILVENSAERKILMEEGIEVAYDGMSIDLSNL